MRYSFLLVAIVVGCQGGGGADRFILARDLNPDDVAGRAMQAFDADGNGQLDANELAKSPALHSARTRLDADKNGSVSSVEIADRYRKYQQQSDLTAPNVSLVKARNPVSGATVVLRPASFVGEDLPEFQGVTDETGQVAFDLSQFARPSLPIGLYDVEVSGPVTASVGCEIAEDTPDRGHVTISL